MFWYITNYGIFQKIGQKRRREDTDVVSEVALIFQKMEEHAAEREERASEREARIRERELELEAKTREREDRREERIMSVFSAMMQQMSSASNPHFIPPSSCSPFPSFHHAPTSPPPDDDYHYSPSP